MTPKRDVLSAADFYDALAEGYDAMTGFAARTARAERFVTDLLHLRGKMAQRATDVGCGTGAYTLALARAGLTALGLDPSPEMVHQARRNAERLGVKQVRFVQAGLGELATEAKEPQNLVICMGNTLPHILETEELQAGLAAARESLDEGGLFAVQVLNYDRILAEQERIVSIDAQGGENFVRFYDFLPDGLVRFNLLRFTTGNGDHRLTGVLLRPYRQAELTALLVAAGFREVVAFGSLDLAPFDAVDSDTLLLVAEA